MGSCGLREGVRWVGRYVIHSCRKLWFAGAHATEQRMPSLSYFIAIVVLTTYAHNREQLCSYVRTYPHTHAHTASGCCTHSPDIWERLAGSNHVHVCTYEHLWKAPTPTVSQGRVRGSSACSAFTCVPPLPCSDCGFGSMYAHLGSSAT